MDHLSFSGSTRCGGLDSLLVDALKHVDMIRHEMAFQYVTLLLPGQLPEDFPQILAELVKEDFPPAFWNPYHMVLAVPYRVA